VTDKLAPERGSGTFVLALLIVAILVAVIVVMYFYHKNKVSNLKTEIAHVQYIADPTSRSDPNHFDNPVYSYQKPDDSSSLLNNATIRNNLGGHKAINLDRQKMGFMEEDDDSCKGAYGGLYGDSLAKNRDADQGNPNVYSIIDDFKDHLYDEIKGKEVTDTYDHLAYDRPSSSSHPNYHRMSNGLVKDPGAKPDTDSNLQK